MNLVGIMIFPDTKPSDLKSKTPGKVPVEEIIKPTKAHQTKASLEELNKTPVEEVIKPFKAAEMNAGQFNELFTRLFTCFGPNQGSP